MKKFIRWTGLGATMALSACAMPADVTDVQNVLGSRAPSGTPFTQALFQEYQAYARQEVASEVEWVDATYTARKAQQVANGETVLPDELTQRNVPAAALPELSSARGRLMNYFANGATERVPAAAAKAQVAFDCWLEQEAQGNAARACRSAFLAHEPMLKKAVAVTEAAIDGRRNFAVTFGNGSAALSDKAHQTLKEVASAQAQMHAPVVHIAGFTDTVGSADANMRLARHRADAVAAELVKLGVSPAVIAVNAFGESRTAVATGDETAEQANRRVEIVVGGTWGHGTYGNYGTYGGYAYGGHDYGWGGYYGANAFAVFFNSGSSQLTPEAVERIKHAFLVQKNLNLKTVRVVGFTDRTGSAATNAKLSRDRAQAVAAEISKLGGTVTSVDARPQDSWGAHNDGHARRVEILFDY